MAFLVCFFIGLGMLLYGAASKQIDFMIFGAVLVITMAIDKESKE